MNQDNIVAMDRGEHPPVLYDGCTVWACYWVDRDGRTLEIFNTSQQGKESCLAVGNSDQHLANLPYRFPINDVIDTLRAAGYDVTRRKPGSQEPMLSPFNEP